MLSITKLDKLLKDPAYSQAEIPHCALRTSTYRENPPDRGALNAASIDSVGQLCAMLMLRKPHLGLAINAAWPSALFLAKS